MTHKPAPTTETALQELLSAIEANIPVAGGSGPCSAEPSFDAEWEVWDKDCTERVRTAAAALKEALRGGPSRLSEQLNRYPRESLLRLLAAIEAARPFASGTGRCPAVPCFDRHDREAESARPGWEVVDRKCANRIRQAVAALVKPC
jgi:hypothetical protein